MKEDYKKLTRAGIVFLCAASLLVFVLTIGVIMNWAHGSKVSTDSVPQIAVTGTGDIMAVPNIATFDYSIIETAKSVTDAQNAATALTNKTLDYLKHQGIADADIQTEGYNITPTYETTTRTGGAVGAYNVVAPTSATAPTAAIAPMPNSVSGNSGSAAGSAAICYNCTTSSQTVTGYEVSQTISVKVRKVDQAGIILAGLGNFGVQNVSGLSLTIDDQDAVMDQARAKAITDAQQKADVLAKQLGVSLVRIISYSDQSGGYYPVAFAAKSAAMDSAGAAPQLPTGQNKITSNVTVTYEIR